ncbi:hypothetical protein MMC29_006178, partial [Sticta canariensis]|nr:hypothetical protein [Sticta canariensis]
MLFTLLLTPLGALAVATTTAQDFDPGQIDAAGPAEYTGPSAGALSQTIPYDPASVSSEGAAAVTADATPQSAVPSLATASIPPSLVAALSDTSTSPTPTIVAKRVTKPPFRFARNLAKVLFFSNSTVRREARNLEDRSIDEATEAEVTGLVGRAEVTGGLVGRAEVTGGLVGSLQIPTQTLGDWIPSKRPGTASWI